MVLTPRWAPSALQAGGAGGGPAHAWSLVVGTMAWFSPGARCPEKMQNPLPCRAQQDLLKGGTVLAPPGSAALPGTPQLEPA